MITDQISLSLCYNNFAVSSTVLTSDLTYFLTLTQSAVLIGWVRCCFCILCSCIL